MSRAAGTVHDGTRGDALTTTTPQSRARLAYAAYGHKVKFKNHLGNPMPMFDDLPEEIQEAWTAAAGVIWSLATIGRAEIT